jgi:hypothetical protein
VLTAETGQNAEHGDFPAFNAAPFPISRTNAVAHAERDFPIPINSPR